MAVTILTPTGTLGYGFREEAFARGLEFNPDVIAVDAGSTDPGPHYLGSNEPLVSRFSIKRELTALLIASRKKRIPLIVGSAGGAGSRPQVDWTVDIVKEVCREQGVKARIAYIYSDIPTDRVRQALRRGEIDRFEADFDLSDDIIDQTTSLVGQMGYEPIIEALLGGADVIIAGRSCDDCVIAAFPISAGADAGLSLHMGKILECGAFSAEPFGMDVMLAKVDQDGFVLEPGSVTRRASVASVAAHSLYEREDPFIQKGPGHVLDLSECKFTQLDDRRVRVHGTKLRNSDDYWIKLEGARISGYRTICVAGIRCPTMIAEIENILADVKIKTQAYFSDPSILVHFHVYGLNGVMGLREVDQRTGHELGLVIETIASTQSLAHAVCHHVSGSLLHHHFTGQINTSGNLAFLYSPSELDAGPAYVFSAYHLMKVELPTEMFPITYVSV